MYRAVPQDLLQCHQKLLGGAKRGSEEPDPIIVLTDSLVALLSRPSGLLREVVSQAFKALAGRVTAEALDILLNAVQVR